MQDAIPLHLVQMIGIRLSTQESNRRRMDSSGRRHEFWPPNFGNHRRSSSFQMRAGGPESGTENSVARAATALRAVP